MSTTMAKLYLFGTLAVICAVFVSAKNTYQRDDANIDEEIDALVRALQEPLTRTGESNATNAASDDTAGDGDADSGTAGDDEDDDDDVLACLDMCGVDTEEDLCSCGDKNCVPDDCPAVREIGDEDEDEEDDEDDDLGEEDEKKGFFLRGRYRKPFSRYRRSRYRRFRTRRYRCPHVRRLRRNRYGKK